MKVVILCGGRGTRLNEETEFKPKPLVEIGGIPILVHIMNHYSAHGFNEFVLCLGYKGYMIKNYFLNFEYMRDFELHLKGKNVRELTNFKMPDWKITFAETGLNTNTGARMKKIERYIDTDTFFLTYGDGVSDVNLNQLLAFHKKHGKVGTVTTVRPTSRFGNLTVEEDNKITNFEKKTRLHEGWIDGGFFVFDKKIFGYVTNDEECMLENEPLKELAKEGEFMAFKHTGFWQCMDTMREVELLNKLWDSAKNAWKI